MVLMLKFTTLTNTVMQMEVPTVVYLTDGNVKHHMPREESDREVIEVHVECGRHVDDVRLCTHSTRKYHAGVKSSLEPDMMLVISRVRVMNPSRPPVKKFMFPLMSTTSMPVFMNIDPKSLVVCARIFRVSVSWPSNSTSTPNVILKSSFTTITPMTASVAMAWCYGKIINVSLQHAPSHALSLFLSKASQQLKN